MPPADCKVERRDDGALLVRVRSRDTESGRPPDAVFTFRAGDPQFLYWDEHLRRQESAVDLTAPFGLLHEQAT